jgi:hypothetical protein
VTAAVRPQALAPTRRPRLARARQLAPVGYLALAMLAAVAILPSALRPPPDPSNESGAISPDAPPDPSAPPQLLQSQQQAAGSGAGAAAGGAPTTTTPGAPVVATTVPAPRAASGQCFGKPPRQVESVYAGACVPGFVGDNGGSTYKNVFANEVRIGFNQIGSPPAGRVPDAATPDETPETRTARVLSVYFNKRFETYGRKVVIYGLASTDYDDAPAQGALAETAEKEYRLFGSFDLNTYFCEEIARRKLVAFCNGEPHATFERNRPYLFSFLPDAEQVMGFTAEYVCKTLKDKPARFGGPDVNGQPRKIGYVTEFNGSGGFPVAMWREAYGRECGGVDVVEVQLASGSEPSAWSAAIAKLRTEGVTTVIDGARLANTIGLMTTAGAAYTPEWVLVSNGNDLDLPGATFPASQAAHMFAVSGWEMALPFQESECYRAYKSIDPDNDPNELTCEALWAYMILFLDGIQGAGPKLTPAAFQKGLYDLGYRYGQAVWSAGGGFGPGDWGYMDNFGEIWWDATATAPQYGTKGAFRWTHGGRRYKRGQLPGDDTELFRRGLSQPPPGS